MGLRGWGAGEANDAEDGFNGFNGCACLNGFDGGKGFEDGEDGNPRQAAMFPTGGPPALPHPRHTPCSPSETPLCKGNTMTPALWIAVAVIAVVTYLTRALPFLWRHAARPGPAPAWLDALGPAILAAMGVAILLPEGITATRTGTLTPFLVGLAATAGVMAWRRDAGLATLAGIAAYALTGLAV